MSSINKDSFVSSFPIYIKFISFSCPIMLSLLLVLYWVRTVEAFLCFVLFLTWGRKVFILSPSSMMFVICLWCSLSKWRNYSVFLVCSVFIMNQCWNDSFLQLLVYSCVFYLYYWYKGLYWVNFKYWTRLEYMRYNPVGCVV